MAKEILCGFGVDVDAVAGWLGSYGGEDFARRYLGRSFAGEVGSPRLLKLFAVGIKTTWFIPGHSIETFPAEMKAVAEAGHEIGIHGYWHERPDRDDARAGNGGAGQMHQPGDDSFPASAPAGYVAPWWEFSSVTNELVDRGIKYDHSLMHHDHQPYYVRVGDRWTKIDYSKAPEGMDGAAAARPGN